MRDCASTNNVAMCTMNILYPSVLDIGCYSHTIDHVRERSSVHLLCMSLVYHRVASLHTAQKLVYCGAFTLDTLWPVTAKTNRGAAGKLTTKY